MIMSLHRRPKQTNKKKKKKLQLSILVPSSGFHTQSSTSERTTRQMGYVRA